MVSFEIIWELLSSELKDTEFWPAIVGSTAIVIALGILLRKIKMIWRKVGAAAAALGLLAAWDGFCLKWHSLLCYHLAGLLFALSVLCFWLRIYGADTAFAASKSCANSKPM